MAEKSIAELIEDLKVAEATLIDLGRKAAAARSAETDALNRLNAVQKAIDSWYKQRRHDSPPDSEWKAADRRGVPVP